jgi:hypothetical protein
VQFEITTVIKLANSITNALTGFIYPEWVYTPK